MSLTVTVTPGHTFPADIPVSLEALRAGAQPSVTVAGAVGTGDLSAGAVTPAKSTPGAYFFADATVSDTPPTVKTYNVTLDPILAAYADGVEVWIKTPATGANTDTSTLNVNSIGAKKVYKQNGQLLVPGDLRNNTVYGFRYNETLDSAAGGWQLFTPLGNGARYVETTGSANAYVYTNGTNGDGDVSNTPTATALSALEGVPLYFKANHTNTGAATLAVDGLAAKAIRKHGDLALAGGEIRTNQIVCVVYDAELNGSAGAFVLLSHVNQPVLVASASNLRVRRHATTPDSVMTVAADEIILRSAAHDHVRVAAVSVNVNIGNTGTAGRTFATEAGDKDYYLWVIAKADGTTSAVISEKAVWADVMAEPSWPADYVYGGMVGRVRNNSGSNFAQYVEYGSRWRSFSTEAAPTNGSGVPISELHYLGETPARVDGFLRCVTNDSPFSAGDVVALTNLRNSSNQPQGSTGANATTVWFAQGAALEVEGNGGAGYINITEANWKVFVVAEL